MLILIYTMLLIWRLGGAVSETPYHYINQVPVTTPEILTPKPLFSPHDVRRESVRPTNPVRSYQTGIVRGQTNQPGYRYGEEHQIQPTSISGPNLIYGDSSSTLYGDQRFWYPIYADIQYPGWLGVSQVPYDLSYGSLPEGYEPKIPLRGDPLGYSFSYSAGDHSRHQTSDGRGNYFSSFSFIPPADSTGVQSNKIPSTLDYGIFSTSRTPTVNIPSLNPGPYSTVTPIHHSFNPSSTRPHLAATPSSRPLDIPTARPLISSLPGQANTGDFTNGFYFSANNYPLNRIPQRPLNVNSHPLSTNIQYDSLAGQSSTQATVAHLDSGRNSIKPLIASRSQQVTTERSYQTLSRSLPLAFSSKRLTTEPSPLISSRAVTDRYFTSPPSRRITEVGSRISSPTFRSAARRSTTERYFSKADPQRSTPFATLSSKKPSVVQKIPRKPKSKNNTVNVDESDSRPLFIDDLTSLAYSTGISGNKMNDTIIQIKPRRDKGLKSQLPDGNEKTVVQGKSPMIPDYLMNSSRTPEIISKDGHVTGNKTYLAGLGLRSNIHY